MRIILIDRANFCDHFDTIKAVLTLCSSIVLSRKRKLRELFAVATDENVFPTFDPSDATAPSTTAAEQKFLIDCDISLYVISIPPFVCMALLSRFVSRWTDSSG